MRQVLNRLIFLLTWLALGIIRGALEAEIDPDSFDQVRSRQLDAIQTLLDSKADARG